jgi:hypothetical protein
MEGAIALPKGRRAALEYRDGLIIAFLNCGRCGFTT